MAARIGRITFKSKNFNAIFDVISRKLQYYAGLCSWGYIGRIKPIVLQQSKENIEVKEVVVGKVVEYIGTDEKTVLDSKQVTDNSRLRRGRRTMRLGWKNKNTR